VNGPLLNKVADTVRWIRKVWPRLEGRKPFIAFSTGKDSLALAAIVYEALETVRPTCLYAHHDMEFPTNLEYLELVKKRGFVVETVHPFLSYFELLDRGIGFVTLKDAWCVPMLVGTGLLEWLQRQGARSVREGIMFRGISSSEHNHKLHAPLELYERLDLPTFNPLLAFSKEEIIQVIQRRYGLPLNPIYEHMDRSYCICCYTSDMRRQAFSWKHFPEICRRYYQSIEEMLFDSGLIDKAGLSEQFKSRREKLDRHGFVHWRRIKAQDVVGAIKRRLDGDLTAYSIRETGWIHEKLLKPVNGHFTISKNEVRFWGVSEETSDLLVKRMMNCLDCGFCVVECFPCRQFDRQKKTLSIDGCIQCGKCLQLKFCMGWRHRFWRRIIVKGSGHEQGSPNRIYRARVSTLQGTGSHQRMSLGDSVSLAWSASQEARCAHRKSEEGLHSGSGMPRATRRISYAAQRRLSQRDRSAGT